MPKLSLSQMAICIGLAQFEYLFWRAMPNLVYMAALALLVAILWSYRPKLVWTKPGGATPPRAAQPAQRATRNAPEEPDF